MLPATAAACHGVERMHEDRKAGMHAAGLSALLHCELAVDMRLPGAAAPWTTLHVPVIVW